MLQDGSFIGCASCGAELFEVLSQFRLLVCLECSEMFLLDKSGRLVRYQDVFPDAKPKPPTPQEKEEFLKRLRPYPN